jgi:hypothetical protein
MSTLPMGKRGSGFLIYRTGEKGTTMQMNKEEDHFTTSIDFRETNSFVSSFSYCVLHFKLEQITV